MGFEPTTTCLGSKDSTPELRPHRSEVLPWVDMGRQAERPKCAMERSVAPSKPDIGYVPAALSPRIARGQNLTVVSLFIDSDRLPERDQGNEMSAARRAGGSRGFRTSWRG